MTKRLTASERDALVRMNIALDILTHEKEKLAQRAELIPRGKRDLATIATLIRKFMTAIKETIPAEQLNTYDNALIMSSYTVGARRPGPDMRNTRDYGMWISYDVLNTLLVGCHDHCMMCELDRGQRRSCPLRKALDAIPNDVEDSDDCPYYVIM